MRAVVQRVSRATVKVENSIISSISHGMVVLLGISISDSETDAVWLANKIANLRIFPDNNGVMNRSLMDISGGVIVVSQFTLFAQVKKGNRPSYIRAARPEIAVPMYENFCKVLSEVIGYEVGRGIFGADMKVKLINDGPVTIVIDTKNKE